MSKQIFPSQEEGSSIMLEILKKKDQVIRPVKVEDEKGTVIADFKDGWSLSFDARRGLVLGYIHLGEHGGYSYSLEYFDKEGDIPYKIFVED